MPLFTIPRFLRLPASLILVGTLLPLVFAAPAVLAPDRADGLYSLGDTVSWTISPPKDPVVPRTLAYTVKSDGLGLVARGSVDLGQGPATVTATRSDPGALLIQFYAPEDRKNILAVGGALFCAEKIRPAAPAPDDFDAFWSAKLAELARVPMNPVLEDTRPAASSSGVRYQKVTLDNVHGAKVRGQLARPVKGVRFPAIVTFQYAGVYPLDPGVVIGDAQLGFLALNISAHDLPIDEKPEFYAAQKQGPFKDYVHIGHDDRERSYFLRMFLGCARAVDYIAGRPDWDGRTLLVTGASQGGLQSLVAAALNEKITGLMVVVPAGCDHLASRAGRAPGWPDWTAEWALAGSDRAKVEETAGYFDGVHFAARVRCPSLVAYGLVDTVSRPAGVAAAINALRGPKEALSLPLCDHQGSGDSQRPYRERALAWKQAALADALPPSMVANAK